MKTKAVRIYAEAPDGSRILIFHGTTPHLDAQGNVEKAWAVRYAGRAVMKGRKVVVEDEQ